jgi:uncharacterized protein (TIGR03382 family)
MRNVAIAALLSLAACSVEDDTPVDLPPGERLCTTNYSLAGTFTLGALPPDRTIQSDDPNLDGKPGADGNADIQGCWPVGTWTLHLTPIDTNCAPAPLTPSEITFNVTRLENTASTDAHYEYELVAPFNYSTCGERSTGNCATVRVSEGGIGCEGAIELFGEGGHDLFQISPAMSMRIVRLDQAPETSALTGSAEFGRYADNQLPAGDPPEAGGCSTTGGAGGGGLLALALAAVLRRRRSPR